MLTSLLFIFKCIIFASNSRAVRQSPDLTPSSNSGPLQTLTAAGAGSGLKSGASKDASFSCIHLAAEPGIAEKCMTVSGNASAL